MNILLWGDLHARMSQGANLKPLVMDLDLSYLSSRLTVVLETLQWLEEDIIKKYDIKKVICGGDIYEHTGVDTYTRNIVYDVIGGIARKVNDNWVTVTGNHDTKSTSDPFDSILFGHNAYSDIIFGTYKIDYIQSINSVFIYVPYFMSKRKLISLYEEIHQKIKKYPKKVNKILIAHHNLKELISHANGPNSKELHLERFTQCYFSHIHYRKSHKNIRSIGSILSENFNDLEDLDRGVTILKINGDANIKEIFVPNPFSPYYVRINRHDVEDGSSEKIKTIKELKKDGRKVYAEFVDVPEDYINTHKYLFDLISISSDIDRGTIDIKSDELSSEALSDWKSYLQERFVEFLNHVYPGEKKNHKKITKLFTNYLKRAEEIE